MPELRLARIPDRTPIKIAIMVLPDLHQSLTAYADAYRETYGETASVADLIPYMLQSFLDSDRAFARSRPKS
ncbi:DUF2274 domain-containing protein [Stakelama tenebrarum]|uniref:DUF2274 domain-containing protein n=1 Tax=Stakelama tenebrarum TaxID=2711215 RepID=A0A6G6Y338_9SPHN|nr:DUF2274 domain-containing protein [Sphingosinithalassobacter tenebrarum]QIG79342.1 DUF2274 domain-containing protein [Sphingosinithalassobacter tenebrarum]